MLKIKAIREQSCEGTVKDGKIIKFDNASTFFLLPSMLGIRTKKPVAMAFVPSNG